MGQRNENYCDGDNDQHIGVGVDHGTMAVTLTLPPDIDDLNDLELQAMVRGITRVREIWEPRGYHVGFDCDGS